MSNQKCREGTLNSAEMGIKNYKSNSNAIISSSSSGDQRSLKEERVTILRYSAGSYFRNTKISTNINHTLQVRSYYPISQMEKKHV